MAASAEQKTFYLSNFQFTRESGRISVGTFFSKPTAVDDVSYDALFTPTEQDRLWLDLRQSTVQSTNEKHRQSKSMSAGAGVWAKILDFFKLGFNTSASRNNVIVIHARQVETVVLSRDLKEYTDSKVTEVDALKQVLAHRPIYMITGIKYATGTRIWTENVRTKKSEAFGGGPVTPDGSVSLGGDIHASSDVQQDGVRTVPGEVILAYSLAMITAKKVNQMADGLLAQHDGEWALECRDIDSVLVTEAMELANIDPAEYHIQTSEPEDSEGTLGGLIFVFKPEDGNDS
ncbi:hypothetical protein GQ53DRAFT_753175 [Thozetella sp. PMI_491]|nr:hypothetical protein GQ53DRAFT_753175 [Thozetella sp. PMI_491]